MSIDSLIEINRIHFKQTRVRKLSTVASKTFLPIKPAIVTFEERMLRSDLSMPKRKQVSFSATLHRPQKQDFVLRLK